MTLRTLFLLLILSVAGCANTPLEEGSLLWIQAECARDRAKNIRALWFRYETENNVRVLNDWHINSRAWGIYHCKTGMAAPGSYPPVTWRDRHRRQDA